jgi:hypothetical protein
VSDNLGRVVLQVKNIPLEKNDQSQILDLSQLNNGIYFIQIREGKWQETKKVLLHK